MKNIRILIVIPARGGSKGIPRKNLRLLNDNPLLYYSIKTALSSKFNSDVVVSSDDDEILAYARIFGAIPYKRSEELGGDEITLDPVIFDAYKYMSKEFVYDYVITMQTTSPILKKESLDEAITLMLYKKLDTVISATDDTHLMWEDRHGIFVPLYEKRLNRQFLPKTLKETGGFLICRSKILSKNTRIGKEVELFKLNHGEEIDIDTYEDWAICESLMKRKTIIFVVSGNVKVGLSHVYRCLLLANGILDNEIIFISGKKDQLAHKIIKEHHYTSINVENIFKYIKNVRPNLVINDILNTSESYIKDIKGVGSKVINFEDMGDGAVFADAVINDMYCDESKIKGQSNHVYNGPEYFCLRSEFRYIGKKVVTKNISSILIAFGGVDACNHTLTVLSSIADYCLKNNIFIRVVLGLGYEKVKTLDYFSGEKYTNIAINDDITELASYIYESDLVFTARGRTVYEVATIGVPTIVIPQNIREECHMFAKESNGFLTFGVEEYSSPSKLLRMFSNLTKDYDRRSKMSGLMNCWDFTDNVSKILKIIRNNL